MSAKRVEISLYNLNKALQSLLEFLRDPIVTHRDMAGVIQAFEYTYEQFWKAFKKTAESESLEALSPRQAIQAAFQLGIIKIEYEAVWVDIIKTRNETSHTYNEDQAKQAVTKIIGPFRECFLDAYQNLTQLQAKANDPRKDGPSTNQ